jgi:hypothetical protein
MAAFIGNPVLRETSRLRNRSMRRPKHSFLVRSKPHRLVPICLAPVMAGDTLKSASYQARAITSPLASTLSGWHAEFWWFFVRIIDMPDGQAIMEKIISEDEAPQGNDTAKASLYSTGINWVERAWTLLLPHYFRDYGESWDSVMDGDLPVVAVRGRSWFDHFTPDDDMPEDEEDATDAENLWSKWQVLSRNRLTTMTYEEYLRSQGVKPPPNLREPDLDLKIPELIRYYRDWQYPVATINPATGVASNAVSWAISDRMDRRRRFAEPGFIIGVATYRPKAYLPIAAGTGDTASGIWQAGAASGFLNRAKAWIPPNYVNEPGESLATFPVGTGPLGSSVSDDYWFDYRNLYLDGDQMVIGAPAGTTLPRRAAPHWRYPTAAGVSALFAAPATDTVDLEGVAAFQIASRVRRTSR